MDIVNIVQEYPKIIFVGGFVTFYIGHRLLHLLKSQKGKAYIDSPEADRDDFSMGEKMPFTGYNTEDFFSMIQELFEKSQK